MLLHIFRYVTCVLQLTFLGRSIRMQSCFHRQHKHRSGWLQTLTCYSFKGQANRKIQSPASLQLPVIGGGQRAFWLAEKAAVAQQINWASLSSVGLGSGLCPEADSDPALAKSLLRTSGIGQRCPGGAKALPSPGLAQLFPCIKWDLWQAEYLHFLTCGPLGMSSLNYVLILNHRLAKRTDSGGQSEHSLDMAEVKRCCLLGGGDPNAKIHIKSSLLIYILK